MEMSNYEQIIKLALERGFYFPSCEIYSDALAGFWEYGPAGVSIKNKFIQLWRREIVRRDGMIEIDGSQIMSRSVFIASRHINNFTDPIIKCMKCSSTFRADKYITEKTDENIHEGISNEKIDALITVVENLVELEDIT
jgi:glycyl-tRNA synthetase